MTTYIYILHLQRETRIMHPSYFMNFAKCFIHTSSFEHLNTSQKEYLKTLELLSSFLDNLLNRFCQQAFVANNTDIKLESESLNTLSKSIDKSNMQHKYSYQVPTFFSVSKLSQKTRTSSNIICIKHSYMESEVII